MYNAFLHRTRAFQVMTLFCSTRFLISILRDVVVERRFGALIEVLAPI